MVTSREDCRKIGAIASSSFSSSGLGLLLERSSFFSFFFFHFFFFFLFFSCVFSVYLSSQCILKVTLLVRKKTYRNKCVLMHSQLVRIRNTLNKSKTPKFISKPLFKSLVQLYNHFFFVMAHQKQVNIFTMPT